MPPGRGRRHATQRRAALAVHDPQKLVLKSRDDSVLWGCGRVHGRGNPDTRPGGTARGAPTSAARCPGVHLPPPGPGPRHPPALHAAAGHPGRAALAGSAGTQGQGLSAGWPPHRGPQAPHPSPPPPRLTPLRIYSLTSHKKSKLKAQKAKFKAHVLRDTHSAGVGFASARGAGAAPAHVTADHLCWVLNRPRSL